MAPNADRTLVVLVPQVGQTADDFSFAIEGARDPIDNRNYVVSVDSTAVSDGQCRRPSLRGAFTKSIWRMEMAHAHRTRLHRAPQVPTSPSEWDTVLVGIDFSAEVAIELVKRRHLPLLNVVTASRGAAIWSPGLIEVVAKHAATGFAVELITPDEQKSSVIYEGACATQSYYARNRVLLLDRGLDAALRCIWRSDLRGTSGSRHIESTVIEPSLPDLIGYVTQQARRLASRRLPRKSEPDPFTVWFRRHGNTVTGASSATAIPNPDNGYFADPFILNEDSGGRQRLVVEEFSDLRGRAHISEITIHSDDSITSRDIINEPFHLSFPFPVYDGDKTYICPESSGSHQVTLYGHSAGHWRPVSTLLDNVDAVDPCIVKQDDRWYLFITADSTGNGELLSQLHVFVADRLDSATWSPHPLNPVLESPFGGRNGGLFRHGTDLLRVGQFHEFGEYGSGIRLYRIVDLSPTSYREELLPEDDPLTQQLPDRAHHLSVSSNALAFDRSSAHQDAGNAARVSDELWP